jgi:dienelactone hydrolase
LASNVSSHVFHETVTTVVRAIGQGWPAVDTDEALLRLGDGDPVHGTLVQPTQAGHPTAVLVIAGSGGGDQFSTATARALAAEGFPALGVGYFKVPGTPDQLRDIRLEYLADAASTLRARCPAATRTVLLGASRGSEAAFLLACHRPDIADAVVGVVPANEAFAHGWTLDGHDLTGPIPLERYDRPVLLLSAAEDEIWPSSTMAADLAQRRDAAGQPVLHHDEPGATHAISAIGPDHPGPWSVLLSFLRRLTD